MKIVILGAGGKTGQHVMRQALAGGHTVTAFIRDNDDVGLQEARLSIIRGDARNEADLSTALMSQDAVISTIGSTKASDKELMTRFMEALVVAARASGVKRVILLSSFLAHPNYRPTGLARLFGFMFKNIVADKSASEKILIGSGLDWTIVYATRLDHASPRRPVRVLGPNEHVSTKNGIARADVAKFLLVHAADKSSIHKKLLITAT